MAQRWTDAGTFRLFDVFPGRQRGAIGNIYKANGQALTFAHDGSFGSEPWCSDGTADGTHLVADVFPGFRGMLEPGSVLGEIGNRAYMVLNYPDTGAEIYSTDCNSVELLFDLNPAGHGVGAAIVANGSIVFSGNEGNGQRGLWISDGTATQPRLLAAFPDSTYVNSPQRLVFDGADNVWFVACTIADLCQFYTVNLTTESVIPVTVSQVTGSQNLFLVAATANGMLA